MMMAAHSDNLKAAAQADLRTAHIARPDEHGPNTREAKLAVPVDFAAMSIEDSGFAARRTRQGMDDG